MSEDNSHAWDSDDGDTEAFDLKMEEWAERDWASWLEDNLSFPFTAKREDDDDDAFFLAASKRETFRLGHKMEVVALEPDEDVDKGFLVKVREGKSEGHVPLADLEVTPKSGRNYWPVKEYAVWFANRT